MGKLTALKVKNAKPGKYGDGDGLWLYVDKTGAKRWVLRYMRNRRAREIGLGSEAVVSLTDARKKAFSAKLQISKGEDPLEIRKQEEARKQAEAAKAMIFRQAAAECIADRQPGWRNEKHAAQWMSTLEHYAFPVIGNTPVDEVDTDSVLKVLRPIWSTKTETANRVRGRIETILDWARVHGYRQQDNPARWRGHLSAILPPRSKVQSVKHHAALPHREIAGFILTVQATGGIVPRLTEFTILTCVRTGEALGARWEEIDEETATWTIPAERMKAKKPHRVPLSGRALEILAEMKTLRLSDYVFPGAKPNKPLSNMAMLKLLSRMDRADITMHGFRSAFRDWTVECTNHPSEVAEMALAHTVGSKVERAYLRSDMFDRRRQLMADWAAYCEPQKVSQEPADGA